MDPNLVIAAMILARFLVPLTIPKWPLPGEIASLVLDAVDQTVFQTFAPNADLSWYQGYDKSLDVYYLTIAYLATLRNWTNGVAFEISRFLLYYRLIGVLVFEITQLRGVLLIFPNTFEYFFVFYEVVRVRWDPRRMDTRLLVGATAFIWIFIKLPQEWWIHVAQLDTTDLIKERIFHVPLDTPWQTIVADNLGLILGFVVLVVLLIAAVWWVITNKLPPADRPITLRADDQQPMVPEERVDVATRRIYGRLVTRELFEKVGMLGLICAIFGQVLPSVSVPTVGLVIGVALVVVINAAASHILASRGHDYSSALMQFGAMLLINGATIVVLDMLLRATSTTGASIDLASGLFFAILLSLMITLYDRYRPINVARFEAEPSEPLNGEPAAA